jgi:hypothetical protein
MRLRMTKTRAQLRSLSFQIGTPPRDAHYNIKQLLVDYQLVKVS